MLARGVKDRRSPFHSPTIATTGPDGRPSLRTVVLRGANRDDARLRFHTDRRSAKFAQLAARAELALHVYDPTRKVQIRIDGAAELATPAEHASIWAGMTAPAKACYQVGLPPGTPLSEPAAAGPGALDEEGGYANFCVFDVRIRRLEWLFLSARGHRRAAFVWEADGPTGTWLVP